ncbi:cellulose biosynthesis cyclic di-GMP-binding regulatory protein BcsB [Paraburkholderia sp. Ac-20347]|uniref:cellulose biosynthesis cyclic di-GMP-binding regulatory protein BcsB n=1 Tax=Paraburkholderia sp. Ac-20347 TaxID=2703892 RepID=UPI00197F1E98|nr:cellulose biosynthesis cyclic di-GMP-binding regulatory protein BcsB [Paraburkholderia sp. Ac-20347]MBN3810680.1 cellulose biosynthesis cyclic di-GMP-binding regulatory protein BcsB [Paraburkholderia sp. Ac-20347]
MRVSVHVRLGALIAGLLVGSSLLAADKPAPATAAGKTTAPGTPNAQTPGSAPASAANATNLAAISATSAQGAGPAVIQTAPGTVAMPNDNANPAPLGPPRTHVFSLRDMGVYGPMELRGLDPTGYMNVDVRTDEVVTSAKLRLMYTYSPSLIYPLSHLKVFVNGEVVATIPLVKESAGQLVTSEINLDPRLFTDYNRISVQMIAHYTLDHCEDPYHTTLWTDVAPQTTLTLNTAGINLPNSLALLPVPFFDRHDNRLLRVPFVLAANAGVPTLHAAGVVSSWLGALASYRGARFPVTRTAPADANAVVLALPGQVPEGISLPEIKGPTISVMSNPAADPQSGRKLLVLAGRTPEELEKAADALVLGQAGMAGSSVIVQSVDLGPARKPYDAPNWVPTDRPVLMRELVSDPQQLQVSGYNPPAIRVNMRVPADLYAWARTNVPLDIRYRYTAPSTWNDSILNVSINDQLVRSQRLKPVTRASDETRISVPLLSGTDARANSNIEIPAFRVGSNNQFQFQFHIDSQKTGLCTSTAADVARAAIDPDSVIDFSGFAHYTALPNLAFFANSGYPFTRMADLAQTAIVIPDTPNAQDQEAVLTMLGHMGQWTGLPALRATLVPASKIDSVSGDDLLVIGSGSGADLLAKWGKDLPLLIERGKTEVTTRDQKSGWPGWLGGTEDDDEPRPAGRSIVSLGGPMAALIGFESPLKSGRSVVALSSTSSAQLGDVLDALEDSGKVAAIHGDLTVVRQNEVEGLRVGERYFVGDLPWYARAWVHISRYPSLMAVAGILAGLIVALTVFWALGRMAARRTGD